MVASRRSVLREALPAVLPAALLRVLGALVAVARAAFAVPVPALFFAIFAPAPFFAIFVPALFFAIFAPALFFAIFAPAPFFAIFAPAPFFAIFVPALFFAIFVPAPFFAVFAPALFSAVFAAASRVARRVTAFRAVLFFLARAAFFLDTAARRAAVFFVLAVAFFLLFPADRGFPAALPAGRREVALDLVFLVAFRLAIGRSPPTVRVREPGRRVARFQG